MDSLFQCSGRPSSLVLYLLVVIFFNQSLGSKILICGTGGRGSHFISDFEIAKALLARGHEVWVVLDEASHNKRSPTIDIPPGIKVTTYHSPIAKYSLTLASRYVSTHLRDANAISPLQYRSATEDREIQASFGGRKINVFQVLGYAHDDVLGSTELIRQLKSVGFDMVIGDAIQTLQVFLSQVLHTPFIQIGLTSVAPFQHDRFAFNPSNPAYVPERQSFLTDDMTFQERRKNTLLYWFTGYFYYEYVLRPMEGILAKHGIRPDANLAQLISEASMWIFNSDFVVDFPRPLNPHFKFVGGFLTGPALPLNEEWQSFVDSSGDHGIVLFALGTLINDELTDEQAEKIATSLSLLPQKVAWSYSGKLPKTLGNNTKVVKWLPQNDLLGHPKTRAFISHGGLNSIHQCIYHAVPMVGIPVFGDQKDNFVRLRAKGLAIILDIRRLTDRSIYEATTEVIYNKTYKESAERYSEIARDRVMPMTPMEETVYWIEYAIKHGTRHLKPRSMQLTTIQYYLLDVIAVYIFILLAAYWIVTRVCCYTCRRSCKRTVVETK